MPHQGYDPADFLRRESSRLFDLAARLQAAPELGFRESRTAAILAEELAPTGAALEHGLALSGVRASVGPEDGTEIVLMADMDALPTPGVPGGVAHSCGHHAQMAIMVAVFRALAAAGIPGREHVRLVFLATPAEEYVNIEERLALRASGRIRFLSGKQELIRMGAFGRAAAVLSYHSMADSAGRRACVNGALNGFMAKRAEFAGRAAHAGAHPDRGINALNAASLALQAIHCQRETFRDADHIRVHPVLREGGLAVNTVPDRAVIETYVRGAGHDAVAEASRKVDRALAAGAVAVGASVRIVDTAGYQAFNPSPGLGRILGEAALRTCPENLIEFGGHDSASDDRGDVACMVPTCQLAYSGFRGAIHGADFACSDPGRAYVEPAEILLNAALALCDGRAAEARRIRAAFAPAFTPDGYVAAVEAMFSDRTLSWDPSGPPPAARA